MLSADDLCVDLTCVLNSGAHHLSCMQYFVCLLMYITFGESQKVEQTTFIFDFKNNDLELFVCD